MVQGSLNKKNVSSCIGTLREMFLLFCLLFPAGFGFFLIILALSLSGHDGITKTAPALIIALTANRIGRMFSAMVSVVPIVKMHDAVISGVAQSLGLICIFVAISRSGVSIFSVLAHFFLGSD